MLLDPSKSGWECRIPQSFKHLPCELTLNSRQELTLKQSPQATSTQSILMLNLALCSYLRNEDVHEPEILTYALQFSLALGDLQCIKRDEEQTCYCSKEPKVTICSQRGSVSSPLRGKQKKQKRLSCE